MEIIKLPSAIEKERKHMRSTNLKKNRNAYNRLKAMMVPNEMKLAQFRKYYHSVLSISEKEVLIRMGIDPWSVEGLKYVGDCKRFKIKLGNSIPNHADQQIEAELNMDELDLTGAESKADE